MKLKQIRLQSLKTQKQVAEGINITQNTYSNYENGKTDPDIKTLIKLADYFNTTVDHLIDHEVPYLINKSMLTDNQLQLFEIIKVLSNEQCMLLEAYAKGLIKGAQERQESIESFMSKKGKV